MPFVIKNDDRLNNIQKLISSITGRHHISTAKSDLALMVEEIIAVFVRILRNATGLEHFVSKILNLIFDIVGTVYHLVIYMQSNKIPKIF